MAATSPTRTTNFSLGLTFALDVGSYVAGAIDPALQETTARIASLAAPLLTECTIVEIPFNRHPLQILYQLAKQDDEPSESDLEEIPEQLCNEIYQAVGSLAKKNEKWGEKHALDDLPRLVKAIRTVVRKRFDTRPPELRNAVVETVYIMAGQPKEGDKKSLAKENTERLIRALHRHCLLDIAGTRIPILSSLEQGAPALSQRFHLYRKEPRRGRICFINGMMNSLT